MDDIRFITVLAPDPHLTWAERVQEAERKDDFAAAMLRGDIERELKDLQEMRRSKACNNGILSSTQSL